MQQQADHFGSNGPGNIGDGNDILEGNFKPDELQFLSSLNLNSFGDPVSSSGSWDISNLENIRDKTFPFAIKATAGLFYWFAVETGMIVPDDVAEESSVSPVFQLAQNYPNPFNPVTNFGFRISAFAEASADRSDRGLVSLKVYDVLGNEVASIVNEELSAGNYKYQWNAGGLASGVYFYQLKAGNFIDTKKIILMK
jgi:hypothetical protein